VRARLIHLLTICSDVTNDVRCSSRLIFCCW
jgi:hypothetical protein